MNTKQMATPKPINKHPRIPILSHSDSEEYLISCLTSETNSFASENESPRINATIKKKFYVE